MQSRSFTVFVALIISFFIATTASAASLTLAWDASGDGSTTGYFVFYGTTSGVYTAQKNAGSATTYRVDGLADGTRYCFAVRASDSAGAQSEPSNEVCATTSGTASTSGGSTGTTTPTTSTRTFALTGSIRQDRYLDLAWAAAPSGATSYRVELGRAPGETAVSTTVGGLQSTFDLTSLGAGTFYVRVRALVNNVPGDQSNEVTIIIGTSSAPSTTGTRTFALTGSVRSDRFLDLTWAAAPSGATSYRVELGRAPGETVVSTTVTGLRSLFDLGSLGAGTFYVRVRALVNNVPGDQSNEVDVTVVGKSSAPQAFAATASFRSAQLSWQAPADGLGASGYQVEIGTTSGGSEAGRVTVNGTSTVVQNLTDGTYFMRVRAMRSSGLGDPSREVNLTIAAGNSTCAQTPSAPAQFTASAQGSLVQLSWRPGSGSAPTAYRLLVGSAPGLQDILTVALSATTSLRATAGNGTYYLRMLAVNTCGSSAWGADTVLTIGPGSGPSSSGQTAPTSTSLPGAPEGLSASVDNGVVTLTWTPPVTGGAATRYIIEASTAGGPVAVDTGHAGTVFTHPNTPSGTYVVRVRAGNAAGAGAASQSVTVVVP